MLKGLLKKDGKKKIRSETQVYTDKGKAPKKKSEGKIKTCILLILN